MRIQRLDLIRYGCFTDRSIKLPCAPSDLHILFGPNEAGKSTALAAVGDLLFGVPSRTPFGFRHELASLRIGARLEGEPGSLEVVRRKGATNTLLGADGLPVPEGEGVLAPYLAGAERGFVERMFSLDHGRLQSGGREILEARDDVGQVLFSAGSGIEGLRERLEELRAEALALWTPRRSKHREYYAALERLSEADGRLRDCALSADRWVELKRAHESAEGAYGKLDAEFRRLFSERERLGRIRRVHWHVRRKHELRDALDSLGEVVMLPEDAGAALAAAKRDEAETATTVAALGNEAKHARADLAKLQPDENPLERAADIRELRDRQVESRGARAELPRYEGELGAAEKEFQRLGAELGWAGDDTTDLTRRVPSLVGVGTVRALLTRRGELEAALHAGTRAVRECAEDLSRREKAAANAPVPVDLTRLVQAIGSPRERRELAAEVRVAESRLEESRARLARELGSLHPGVGSEEDLAGMPVPAREQVEQHRGHAREWANRSAQAALRADSLRRYLERATAAQQRLVNEEDAVSAEALVEARHHRDALWSAVKRRFGHQSEGSAESMVESKDPLGAYERAVADADVLADRRFEHAEAAGRLCEVEHAVEELQRQLAECAQEQTRLRERGEESNAAWAALWRDVPFGPLEPERMLAWLAARERILHARTEARRAVSDLDALRVHERDARTTVTEELVALGADRSTLETLSLEELFEAALEERRRRENEREDHARLFVEVETAREEVQRRDRDLASAREAWSSWEERWSAAIADVALRADTAPQMAEARLESIERARELAGRIGHLREEIAKTRREKTALERSAGELIERIAPDLATSPTEEAVLELERRLAEAERVHGLRKAKAAEADALDARMEEHREALARAGASVAHLMEAAQVDSTRALKHAIERSDRRRALEAEREALTAKLLEDGDGHQIEVLEEECDGVDLDDTAAREGELQAKLEALRTRLTEATEERSRARDAFAAIGGNDAAVHAAADREDALAELRDISERYVRARGSALILEWTIDRYRRERQAPLLKRAAELFRTLTANSFTGLRVDYDAKDRAVLVGLRPDGEAVPVHGLSAGTADQLFLALRIGAVEEYLDKAGPLPFIADDLFIHFDDERAAAGLRVLACLAQQTQVLIFTHHRHLVDIARAALGDPCRVVDLGSPERRSAPFHSNGGDPTMDSIPSNRAQIGTCGLCGSELFPESFRDRESYLEFHATALCQTCQDNTFLGADPDEPGNRFRILDGAIVSVPASGARVSEICLLPFRLVEPPRSEIVWEPRFLVRAGALLDRLDASHELEPMHELLEDHQVRLGEHPSFEAPMVTKRVANTRLIIGLDRGSLDAAQRVCRLRDDVFLASLADEVPWESALGRSLRPLNAWWGAEPGRLSTLRTCALMGMLLIERGRQGLRPLDYLLASRPEFETEPSDETA